jgi:excisionase family DNA binding protein
MRLLQGELLNKAQLRERLNLGPRSVDELIRTRKIPVIRMGHRTVRFSWPDVEAALEKLTVRAIE